MSGHWSPRRSWRRLRDDRGSIIPLVPILVLALLMLGGLIVDGTRDLNARAEAQAFAEEAARAGATAVNFTTGDLTLDQSLATSRVAAYCARVLDAPGSAVSGCRLADQQFTDATNCEGKTEPIVVNTVVTMRIHTTLLGITGLSALTSTGAAKARPYEGLTAADAC